jgi:hypothetical protein
MKLSTLLLSSAAVLVAGSAFAADLPSKKAAPAAAVTVCKVGDATGFTLPGSDNCLTIGGWVRYMGTFDSDADRNYTQNGNYRLNVAVRSNSEVGVINGFFRFQGNNDLNKAYVQIGGFTAGIHDSLADIAGTNAENYGSDLGGGTGKGVKYSMSAGAATVAVALEEPADNETTADRPDVLASLGVKAGPADLKLVGVSHDAGGENGYAVLGRAGVSLGGPVSAAVFGGYSVAALKYTGVFGGIDDTSATDEATGTNFGAEVKFDAGVGTLAIAANQASSELGAAEVTRTNYGVSFVYSGIKGISIEPEFVHSEEDGGTDSNIAYLRIQRDF